MRFTSVDSVTENKLADDIDGMALSFALERPVAFA